MKKFRITNFTLLIGLILFVGAGVCDSLASSPIELLRVISIIGISIVCSAMFAYTVGLSMIAKKESSRLYSAHLLISVPLVIAFAMVLTFTSWLDFSVLVEGYVGVFKNFGYNIFSTVTSPLFWGLVSIIEIIDLIILFFGKRTIPADPVQ